LSKKNIKNNTKFFDPEKYMQLSIAAMNDSINETRNDGKISPKVGAVLIFPDGTIQTASRGELRLGDHAEFTLLERKNRSTKLEGSILFATLEPCAPGARNHPKLACAERIVNARIKEVWVGIEDPDPDVDRKGIKFLEENGVKVHMFYPTFQKIIKESNKEFLNQAIERANVSSKKKEIILSTLEHSVVSKNLEELSEKAIKYYIEKSKLPFKFDSDDFWLHFEQVGIVKKSLIKGKQQLTPSGFGILLFGTNSRENYQHSIVKAKVKYGKNAPIPKDFDGPLVLIPNEIELWLQQVLHSKVNRNQFQRDTNTLFPIEPLREAIINALVHRDYELVGAKTFIEIDDDKIIIKSAGLPVSPITFADVKAFSAPSLSRNPKITYVFNKMGLMEENELGMETFRSMQEKYNLPLPFYSYQAPYLSLAFSRNIEAMRAVIQNPILNKLNSEELKSYEIFRTHKSITKKEFAKYNNLKDRTAERVLKKLVDFNLIIKQGSGPNTSYSILD
jgi:ATP-dependent DNA helicase RecG